MQTSARSPGTLPLRVVTLWRPWDYAIIRLDKRVENRGWLPSSLPCPWMMAVRGGQRREPAFIGAPKENEWPPGHVSGIAEVVRYEQPAEGSKDRWRDPSSFGWMLGRVAPLPEPILWPPQKRDPKDKRSMQGLVALCPDAYSYDAELLEALRKAWAPKR